MSINPFQDSEVPVANDKYPDGQKPFVDGIDNDVNGLGVDHIHISIPNCFKSADQKAAAEVQADVDYRQDRLSKIASQAHAAYEAQIKDCERRGKQPAYDENYYINQLRGDI